MRELDRPLACVLLMSVLAGCSDWRRARPIRQLEDPPARRATAYLAYFVSPALKQAVYARYTPAAGGASLKMGEAMETGIPAVMRAAFERSVAIEEPVVSALPQGVSCLLIPELLDVNMEMTTLSFRKDVGAIRMRWTALGPNGSSVWVQTITGESSGMCMSERCRKEVLERALVDQFHKAAYELARANWREMTCDR